MEAYLVVILVGAIVSALAYGIYDLSNVHFTGEFVIPAENVTTTSTTNVFTATPAITETPTAGTQNIQVTTTSTTSLSNPTPKVSFNEIMYDPSGSDEDKEWVEIYADSMVNISGWKFFESNTNHKISAKGLSVFTGYAVIANNASKFLELYPSFSGVLFESPFSLGNSGEHLELRDSGLKTINAIDYSSSLGANGNGKSLEYRDIGWGESSVDGGTPGSKNSQPSLTTSTTSQSTSITQSTSSTISTTTTTSSTTTQSTISTSSTTTQSASSTTTTSQTSSTSTTTQTMQNLFLSISVANQTIVRGHSQTITVTVSDGSNVVESASVNSTVTYASGSTQKFSGTTNSTGEYSYTWTIGGNSQIGTFTVTATAIKNGYNSGSASTAFQVIAAQ